MGHFYQPPHRRSLKRSKKDERARDKLWWIVNLCIWHDYQTDRVTETIDKTLKKIKPPKICHKWGRCFPGPLPVLGDIES